ncbi:MAG: glycerol-3-phosphate ABC transporter ATP-binding protein [Bacteroidetes bacterium 4572_77]|nr:MAG: glycerol-3-phosphate ABC transporter ATP-binding protein [Bacteroidetes bacterium 4572_77]
MSEIKLENISKIYDGKDKAVNSINLLIKDKEFLVLVGPSGCGKSTTLRMIAGLEEISEGALYIGDKLVNDVSPKDRDISIVFQNYALYPHMTAYQNLAFGLKIKKIPKDIIHEKVMKAAKILEIEDLLEKKPKSMSGGQNQRVAIGRAIVRDPKVFLFDEPLSNLDAKLRGQMRIEIAQLHKKLQTTVVYVTHDQVEAMTLGDRIVIMDKGNIQQVDTPSELYRNPKNLFVAGFIGTPTMNFIEGKIVQNNNQLTFIDTSNTFRFLIAGNHYINKFVDEDITLGIRSEDITKEINKEANTNEYASLNCKIQYVEELGHEIFAFAKLHNTEIVSRLKPNTEIVIDKPTKLFLKIDKMHFFNSKSGHIIL